MNKTPTTSPATGDSSSRPTWPVRHGGWLVIAVAVLARIIFLQQHTDSPTFFAPIIDAWTYHQHALTLATENRLPEGIFWQAVFYPLFLGGIYKIFGVSVLAAKIVQSALGCVTTYLVWRLGHRLAGPVVGLIAGLALALYGPAIFFEAELLAVGWAMFWVVLLALLLLSAEEHPRVLSLVALGVVAALSVYNRPTFLLPEILCAAWLLWRWRKDGGAWHTVLRRGGLLLAGWFLVVAPMLALTQRTTGRTFLLPPSGGINLYIGNNPDYDETICTRVGWAWYKLRRRPVEAGARDAADPFGRQAWFKSEVWRFARQDPIRFLAGLGRKSLQFISSRELPRNVDIYGQRAWSDWLATLVWRAGPFGFPFGLVLPLAAVGLIWGRPRLPLSFWLLIVGFAAAVVLVFVAARYRLVVVPLLLIPAAQGARELLATVRTGDRRRRLLQPAVLLAGVLLATIPGPFAQEQDDLSAEMYYATGAYHYRQQDFEQAVADLHRALEHQPDLIEAHNTLGKTCFALGDFRGALFHIGESVRLEPDYIDGRRNLQTLAEEGAARLQHSRQLIAAGDTVQARTLLQQALAMTSDTLHPQLHQEIAATLSRLP